MRIMHDLGITPTQETGIEFALARLRAAIDSLEEKPRFTQEKPGDPVVLKEINDINFRKLMDETVAIGKLRSRELEENRKYSVIASEKDSFTLQMERWGELDKGLYELESKIEWKDKQSFFYGKVIEKRATDSYYEYVIGEIEEKSFSLQELELNLYKEKPNAQVYA